MSLVSAIALAKHYGSQRCFQDASFSLEEGDRIALIGANGTGKTTLFRIILGATEFDGTLSLQKGLRIGVLEQDPRLPAGATVREAVLEASPVGGLERAMAGLHEQLGLPDADTPGLLVRLGELETRFEQAGGYAVESLAERILDGLDLPGSRHAERVETLSGGERSRLALARLLLSAPDLWLLDEPTNHLDLDGIAFLEDFLSRCRASVLVISHDRHFLDAVTTRTWEIEGERLWSYPAPYTRAKALREDRIKAARRAYDIQRGVIAGEEEYIRRYGAGQRARQARGRATRLAKVARLEDPEARSRALALNLPPGEPLGAKPVLEVRELSLDYGAGPLFQDLAFALEPGETLGVVGPNGAGKTSLFNLLTGAIPAGTGRIGWSAKTKRGILSQHEHFPEDAGTPFSYLRNHEPKRTNQELRNTLGTLCFEGESANKPIAALSGGERKRLMMTRLLLEGNNVLLLDEPTNHLDLPSREAVEFALSVFEGSLLVISHDRYFLDRLADRVLWIQDGRWTLTIGGFTQAQEVRRKAVAAAPAPKPTGGKEAKRKPAPPARHEPAVPGLARLTTEALERRIIRCEERIATLEHRHADPEVYRSGTKSKTLSAELEGSRRELAALEAEYQGRG